MADPYQTLTRPGARAAQYRDTGSKALPCRAHRVPIWGILLEDRAGNIAMPSKDFADPVTKTTEWDSIQTFRSPVTPDPSKCKGSDLTRGLVKVRLPPFLSSKQSPRIKTSGKIRGNELVRSQKIKQNEIIKQNHETASRLKNTDTCSHITYKLCSKLFD